MSGARITIAGLSLPLTPLGPGAGDVPAPEHANPGRKLMDHTTAEPAAGGTAHVSIGGFRVRADPRSPRTPSPAQPAPAPPRSAPPRQQQPPKPQPKPAPMAAQAALRLVSSTAKPNPSTAKPGPSKPPPRTAEDAWRYWISVAFTDGHTGATLELRRSTPIISSDDRSAVADRIAAHMKRPVASINFITPIARPNSVTGEAEPDVPSNLRTSPADAARPWRYRVSYATDSGRGECKVDRSGPIRGGNDLKAIQNEITALYGRNVVAIESFSVLAAPAETGPRRIQR